ncbi:uncharacterized protein LOC134657745 [Cydia amplana]|uniref:uncharacterized protein LOC134657745 n=1 Tax=Cydia amplana TaxID=1869771 RepID=UPI002FE63EE4
MDELQKLIREMQSDLNNKFASIETQVSQIPELEEKISSSIKTHMDEKFENLNGDLGNIHSQIKEQEKRLDLLERNAIQRNLVFFGVEESEKSYFHLQNNIIDIVNNKMKVSILELEVQAVRRMGKKGDRPRPISVTFSTLGKKIKILQTKKELKGSNIYIKEEFPAKILKVEELEKKRQEEINKGNTAFIKYDKLVVKEKKAGLNTNKRQLSVSPPQSIQSSSAIAASLTSTQANKEPLIIHSNKKYKARNSMLSYVIRDEEA